MERESTPTNLSPAPSATITLVPSGKRETTRSTSFGIVTVLSNWSTIVPINGAGVSFPVAKAQPTTEDTRRQATIRTIRINFFILCLFSKILFLTVPKYFLSKSFAFCSEFFAAFL